MTLKLVSLARNLKFEICIMTYVSLIKTTSVLILKFDRTSKLNLKEMPEVEDKYRLVYLMFLAHGIGILMPWNMFINANDVRIAFKTKSLS